MNWDRSEIDMDKIKKIDTSSRLDDWLPKQISRFELRDILFTGQHSTDFIYTRADYIARRLRFMLLVFSVAISLWIPVDYLTLSAEHFNQIVWSRLTLSSTLAGLWLASLLLKRPVLVYGILSLTLMAVLTFYLIAMLVMQSGVAEIPQEGYRAIPFLMIALTGLFPLTLLVGLANILLISAFFVVLAILQGNLTSIETLNQLWVLVLVSGCTLWIQSGQLLMLLKLYRESTRDPLTGLINRRVLMKQLGIVLEQFEAEQRPFTLMMFDLDRFKRINDRYGHLTGDIVLKQAAEILKSNSRPVDVVARYGGEEFVVLLPGMTAEQSLPLAEQIRMAVEQQTMCSQQGDSIKVTTSIGLTEHRAGEGLTETIDRADSLLYLAKEQGRNQVVMANNSDAVADSSADSYSQRVDA